MAHPQPEEPAVPSEERQEKLFATFFAALYPAVRSAAYARTSDGQDAEDSAEEVFTAAWRTMAVVGLFLAVLAGCSGPSDAPSARVDPGIASGVGPLSGTPLSQEQKDALADNVVTYDEYTSGYRRYVACMAASGYHIVEQGQENQVFRYAVPAAAVDAGVDDQCMDQQFWYINSMWQLSREDTSTQSEGYAKCLRAKGIEPAEHAADRYQQVVDAGLDPVKCAAG